MICLKEKYSINAFSNIVEKSDKQFEIASNYTKHSIVVKNKLIKNIAVYNFFDDDSYYLYIVREDENIFFYIMSDDSFSRVDNIFMIRKNNNIIRYRFRDFNMNIELNVDTFEIKYKLGSQKIVSKKNIIDKYFIDLFNDLKRIYNYNKSEEKRKEILRKKDKIFSQEIVGRFIVRKPLRPVSNPIQIHAIRIPVNIVYIL